MRQGRGRDKMEGIQGKTEKIGGSIEPNTVEASIYVWYNEIAK